MKLFYLYSIVSVTWFVLSFCSTESKSEKSVNPTQGSQQKAFPQSKVINIHKQFRLKSSELKTIKQALQKLLHDLSVSAKKQTKRQVKRKISTKVKAHLKPQWDDWTDWSTCSVSCGKGRNIRWRHCSQNCADLNTEMEEKACQLPACGGKLFGFITL